MEQYKNLTISSLSCKFLENETRGNSAILKEIIEPISFEHEEFSFLCFGYHNDGLFNPEPKHYIMRVLPLTEETIGKAREFLKDYEKLSKVFKDAYFETDSGYLDVPLFRGVVHYGKGDALITCVGCKLSGTTD